MNYLQSHYPPLFNRGEIIKMLMVMKITVIILLATFLQVSASGTAQNVTLSVKNAPIQKVFLEIYKQTGFQVVYKDVLLDPIGKLTLDVKDKPVEELLSQCFSNLPVTFTVVDKMITVNPKKRAEIITSNEINIEESQPIIVIKGKVTNNKGETLPGVSIVVKGSTRGISTNEKGEYELQVFNNDKILIFSSVGMKTQEILINGRTQINVVMEDEVSKLAEVTIVSTGYQTISKERATGSFYKISEQKISNRVVSDLSQVFSGMSTGIERKADGALLIRGKSTLTGETSPLIVVDGFPIEGQFSSINPNDVLSINILKDAAATSIYGSRAANGVIVVTTKKAKENNKLSVDVSTFTRFGDKMNLDYNLNIANSKSQVEYNERFYRLFKPAFGTSEKVVNSTGQVRFLLSESMQNIAELDRGAITQEEYNKRRENLINRDFKTQYEEYLLRNLLQEQFNIVVSSSSTNNSLKLSLLYEKDKTGFQYNDNNKLLVNLNNTFKLNDKLSYSTTINANMINGENNAPSLGAIKSVTSAYSQLLDESGNYTSMAAPGSIYIPFMTQFNGLLPYNDMKYNLLQESREKRILNNKFDFRWQNRIEWAITNGLKFSTQYQFERNNFRNEQYYNENTFHTRNILNITSKLNTVTGKYEAQFPKGTIAKDQSGLFTSHSGRAQLDYSKTIANKHAIVALAGGEISSTKNTIYRDGYRFGYNERSLVAPAFNYAPISGAFLYFDTKTSFSNIYPYENDGAYAYYYNLAQYSSDRMMIDRYLAGYCNWYLSYSSKCTNTVR